MRTAPLPADQLTGRALASEQLLSRLPARLRLGTRRSALARTQSQWVADRLTGALAAAGHDVVLELVDVTTEGDLSSAPLASLGGTGVFVSALREALHAGDIDLAVHSLKDLPTAAAPGLALAAVPIREDPRDALVARDRLSLAQLPPGSRIGTGSPRRAAQLAARSRALGLGLAVLDVRGNVDTRLRLVAEGRLEAVVLARAGLLRLGRAGEASEVFDPDVMLPAPGQGALAVETRAGDGALRVALGLLDDAASRLAVLAERALLARLEAGCAAPVGALAQLDRVAGGFELALRGRVVGADGAGSFTRSDRARLEPVELGDEAHAGTATALGAGLADQLLADGAADLIATTAAMAREGDS